MSDLERGTRWYEVRLTGREVSGIVAGSLIMLGISFGLGVGLGHRLATPPAPVKPPVEPVADAGMAAEPNYTFLHRLTTPDKTPPAPLENPLVKAKPSPPPPAPPPAPAPPAPPPVAMAAATPDKMAPPVVPSPPPEPVRALPLPPPSRDPRDDQYTVQFAAPSNPEDAARLVRKLEGLHLEPYVQLTQIPHKGRFFRVRAGHFRTRDAAERWRETVVAPHHLESQVMPVH